MEKKLIEIDANGLSKKKIKYWRPKAALEHVARRSCYTSLRKGLAYFALGSTSPVASRIALYFAAYGSSQSTHCTLYRLLLGSNVYLCTDLEAFMLP